MALAAFSSGCQLLRSLCKTVPVTYMGCQQQRNAVKLRRRYPPPIPSLRGKPHRVKTSHYVYVLEADSMHDPKPKLQVILTEDVPRIGSRGDIVAVDRSMARNRLLGKNVAVYASPENIKEFALEKQEREMEGSQLLTPTALKTIEYLKKSRLTLRIRSVPIWDVLPKEAVIHAFDKHLGVVVADHALELPEEPITDYGTYTVKVTVNKLETVPIEMDVKRYINKGQMKRLAAKAAKAPRESAVLD
ncbi:39S ribosomal protein L9, mitochondrial-like [Patiria miniata]|uniref:Large ribosomal subunit protein bL9m n=1 Tax=Patiria miniata TaxID=46514 RepID=A0A914BNL2_PATMI|nr:39S ribosomal protein L9, mitochondrial-like [Patiria miniata]XP_038077073.1 39S ribosomal protein L9, mitochondrial-like [Patiria miniata]